MTVLKEPLDMRWKKKEKKEQICFCLCSWWNDVDWIGDNIDNHGDAIVSFSSQQTWWILFDKVDEDDCFASRKKMYQILAKWLQ